MYRSRTLSYVLSVVAQQSGFNKRSFVDILLKSGAKLIDTVQAHLADVYARRQPARTHPEMPGADANRR
ncbi:hypothetical protein V5799_010709 [Amblyomma americanum]|uniref:Uncharacterized protein n=1 Tax=Amblyomma americanum TaxID=6943 RepID=A0AAQ4EJH0_AMBAM